MATVVGRTVTLAVLAASGAFGATNVARARSSVRQFYVPVLIYHHIKLSKPTDDATERGLTIYPSQFEAHVRFLRTHGYHTVTAARLVDALRGKGSLPSHPVVLTFDDGYSDVFQNAYPLLLKNHMTATFFIIAGLVGQPRYLTWSQIAIMSRHGMDIEAHTMTHPDLTLVSAAQDWTEIDQSRLTLQRRLHETVRVFCYPYGDYNTRVLKDVAKAGYWAAFTTQEGFEEGSAHLLILPRVYANHSDVVPVSPSLVQPG